MVPPVNYQIYKKIGYHCDARHVPGEEEIALDWTLNQPTWDQLLQHIVNFPPGDWYNDAVRQQVNSWQPDKWTTRIQCPVPQVPDFFRTGGDTHFSFVAIPMSIGEERRAPLMSNDENVVPHFINCNAQLINGNPPDATEILNYEKVGQSPFFLSPERVMKPGTDAS